MLKDPAFGPKILVLVFENILLFGRPRSLVDCSCCSNGVLLYTVGVGLGCPSDPTWPDPINERGNSFREF